MSEDSDPSAGSEPRPGAPRDRSGASEKWLRSWVFGPGDPEPDDRSRGCADSRAADSSSTDGFAAAGGAGNPPIAGGPDNSAPDGGRDAVPHFGAGHGSDDALTAVNASPAGPDAGTTSHPGSAAHPAPAPIAGFGTGNSSFSEHADDLGGAPGLRGADFQPRYLGVDSPLGHVTGAAVPRLPDGLADDIPTEVHLDLGAARTSTTARPKQRRRLLPIAAVGLVGAALVGSALAAVGILPTPAPRSGSARPAAQAGAGEIPVVPPVAANPSPSAGSVAVGSPPSPGVTQPSAAAGDGAGTGGGLGTGFNGGAGTAVGGQRPDGPTAEMPAGWSTAARTARSVVSVIQSGPGRTSSGAGIVVDDAGHVVTNLHVVNETGTLQVGLPDGRLLPARVIGADVWTDVAVLAVTPDAAALPAPAQFAGPEAIAVGEPVLTMGNPLGLGSTVTSGIISATKRVVVTQVAPGPGSQVLDVALDTIQTDAPMNPGNSGGALVDVRGRVVGLTCAIASIAGSAGSIGIGFAIPASTVLRKVREIIATGRVTTAALGVTVEDGQRTGPTQVTRLAAVITQVVAGSAAETAGLQAGDAVIAIDGRPVTGEKTLRAVVLAASVGDRITLSVLRDDGIIRTPVTLTPATQP